mgnify:FL=1
MRVVAIGTKIFVNAFRLVGADGIEVSNSRQMLEELQRVLSSGDVGLVLLGNDLD